MKRLLILLMLCLPMLLNAQVLDVVKDGYYSVMLGDSIVSNHQDSNKAVIRMFAEQIANPSGAYYVHQPRLEPRVKYDDLQELICNCVEEPPIVDLGTTVLEPLPNHPVIDSVTLSHDAYHVYYRLSQGSEYPPGGFDVYVNGTDTNNHHDPLTNGWFMHVEGLDTSLQHEFFLEARYTNSDPLVFPRSNTVGYPVNTMTIEVVETEDLLLSDFDEFDVLVTSRHMDTLLIGKQKDIVNNPTIPLLPHVFMVYTTHPAYSESVYKVKVEDGILKYATIDN